MKRIAVRLTGKPFDPTHGIDDDTIAARARVRAPGSRSSCPQEGETGAVIALESTAPTTARRAPRPETSPHAQDKI